MASARSTTIRAELTRVVLAAALPVWLASAVLLYEDQADDRALIERDARATARALMVAVDRDLASARTAAEVLATSPYLLSGDLGAFYAQAKAILPTSGGNDLVLSDASGQEMLNTLRPYGEELPRHGDPKLVERVFAIGQPAVSDLYSNGVLLGRPTVSIDVPVFRGGAVVYDLSVGLFPDRLGDILHQEQLPASWIASIFDSKGVYVARTRAASRFVGQKGTPALVNSIAQNAEAVVETRTLEGIPATALFSRSQVSNWAVVIYVPTAELTVQLWKSMALSTGATLALLALSLVAARLTGERLARPIRALATQALAHGRGERIELPPFRLKEADDLARAFAEGSRLLEDRTAERDRAEGQRQQIIVAKQLADEAARARSAYFSYLSHELRTPLMAVLACSELMARHTRATSLDEKSLNYCARIDTAVQHLISVIDEILDYAKFEAHEIELHKEPLDVAKEVCGAVDLLEGRAEQTGVALRYEVAPNLPPLLADRMRLQQILLNLLSNALKFSPRGGTVTVSAALAEDSQLVIRVKDSGVGISDDDLPRVMQPFAQVLNAQTAKIKGTGLGLPLTKGLVELHGGTFALASVPNVGTTVTVCLPLDAAATEPLGRSRPLATLS